MEDAEAVVRVKLPMHGFSHKLSGSDPLDVELPTLLARASSQSFTADAEVIWDDVVVNCRNYFAWDEPGDAEGVLLEKSGTYMFAAQARNASGDALDPKAIFLRVGANFMSDDLDAYIAGEGQSQVSLGAVDATVPISKSVLNLLNIDLISVPDPASPVRIAMHVDHQGTDFVLSPILLYITRLASVPAGVPQLPLVP